MQLRNVERITSASLARIAAFAFLLLLPPASAISEPVALAAVSRGLIGTWQSLDDTKFTREFAADGTAIDRYEGDESATTRGTWLLFSGAAPPAEAKARALDAGTTYLELKQSGDLLFFALTGLTAQSLRMIYLERGNQLSFARLK